MRLFFLAFALISLVAPLEEVPENYTLIFKQDFTSEEDLEKNWDSQIGIGNNGWGNQEKEYYRTSKNNVYIKDNQLHIRAVKEKIQNNNYTSARIITKTAFKFKYGYLKTRVKLPKAKGIWPAFWLLGSNIDDVNWPKCGEIDIIEAVNDNDEIYTTVHWFDDGTDHKADYGTRYNITKRDEFHDYEFYWDEKYIRVFVDGSKTYEIDIANIKTNAFTKEFYLLLNVAVGGLLPGFDIDDSKFPLEMVVDYIEVYQKNINYKHTQKNLIFELAPEIKPWPIEQNEHIFLKDGILHLKDFLSFWLPNAKGLPCFKYGEIKMTVSLPDKKGISTKIYLFKRDKFYYSKGVPTMIDNVKGEIAIVTAKDGAHTIISGCEWNGGTYYKTIKDFEPNDYIDYIFKWDSKFIIIYVNDVEIYKIDLQPLTDFKDYYYFLYFLNEKTDSKAESIPEILIKEFKVYQNTKDLIIGLPEHSLGFNININIWVLIILILLNYF